MREYVSTSTSCSPGISIQALFMLANKMVQGHQAGLEAGWHNTALSCIVPLKSRHFCLQFLQIRCLHQNCLLAQMPGLPEFLKHAECFKECASTVHIWPHGNEKTWTLACCILLVGGYPYTDWYGPLNRYMGFRTHRH